MEQLPVNAEQLLAENLRLKRLISRFSDKEMSNGHIMPANSQSSVYLPLAVSQALSASGLFGERIKNALQLINQFAEASHILLFHYNNHSKSHIFLEGNGNIIQPSVSNKLTNWDDLYRYLKTIENGYTHLTGNTSELPLAIQPFVSDKPESWSILLFPLTANDEITGFLAFAESSFAREWFSFEKEILALVTNQLSDAFQHNRDQIELEKKEALNAYLLKIAETFSQNDRFEIQANRTLEVTARFFGFSRGLLFKNSDSDHCSVADEWGKAGLYPVGNKFQAISYSQHLQGFKELLLQKKIVTCQHEGARIACQYLKTGDSASKLIIPILTINQFHGFMMFDDAMQHRNWNDDEKNAFIVVSDIFASAFERQYAMDHMIASHQEAIRLTKTLTEKEEYLESILSSIPVGIMIVRNREIIFANRFILEQTQVSESDIIGCHLSQLYYDKTQGMQDPEEFYRQINLNGIATMEANMCNFEGRAVHSHIVGKHCPINGLRDAYLLIAQDITTLRQTQTQLIESDECSQKILETSIEGVLVFDSVDKICYINKAAAEMLEFETCDTDEISTCEIFGTGKELKLFHQAIHSISSGNDFRNDMRVWTKNGNEIVVEAFGTSIILKGKHQYYFSLRNITDRKRQEMAIIQSEKKFRSLTENTTDQIIRLSVDGKLIFANPAFYDFYQLNEQVSISKHITTIKQFPLAFAQTIEKGCHTLMENIEMISLQTEESTNMMDKMVWIEWRISPETNAFGLIESFLCSGRDITHRKLAEQELHIAKEKAVSADRLKSAFLANLSHEVRTPLNAIVGFSTLLKEQDTTSAEREEFVNIITRSADHLMALISDIVDIAKIESGELSITKSSFSINELLKKIYLNFQKRIKLEKRHAIEQLILEIPTGYNDPIVVSDPSRITQIFNSLLDNAIKFTPKGVISFGYVIDHGMFRFYVKDTGIGIDHDKLGIIFQPFRQADESNSRKYGGTGLGLSISRKLTEALGGTIHVHSMPNEGSEFYFEIPDIHHHTPPSKPKVEIAQTLQAPPRFSYHWNDKIILLVDANSNTHLQVRKFLEKTGVTLISARTSASARELIKNRHAIDMIITSLHMPDVNASEFAVLVKQHRHQIPLIGIAEPQGGYNRENVLEAGYDELLFMPLERDPFMLKANLFLSTNGTQASVKKVEKLTER